MKFCLAGHTPIGVPIAVGSHHYAKALAKMGHHVEHFTIPFSLFDLFSSNPFNWGKQIMIGVINGKGLLTDFFKHTNLTQRHPFTVIPRKLLPQSKIFDLLYTSLTIPFIKKHYDVLIIDHPWQYWILSKIKADKVIYRITDTYVYEGVDKYKLLKYLESLIINRCDGLIVTSSVIIDNLKVTHENVDFANLPTVYLSNGVDVEYFNGALISSSESSRGNTVVYMGATDFRFDTSLLIKLAKVNKELEFKIIGNITPDFKDEVSVCNNINCIGPKAYHELAEELVTCKVGLLLANNHKVNQSRSPMKLYEYAAAGLPVVCKSTPEVERRNEPFVLTYTDEVGAIDAINIAINNFDLLSLEASRSAQIHSWVNKARKLVDFIEQVESRYH